MRIIKIAENNQIVIPRIILKQLELKEGDQLEVMVDGKKLILEKVVIDPLDVSFGAWLGEKEGKEYVDEIRPGWQKREERLVIE